MRLACLTLLAALLAGCGQTPEPVTEGRQDVKAVMKLAGEAQGTTYSILYTGDKEVRKEGIDSLLAALDMSLSTYVDNSTISKFNRGEIDPDSAAGDRHFQFMVMYSDQLHGQTKGAFDPTVSRLVNYWGWGPGEKFVREEYDSTTVDSLLQFVGMNKYSDKIARIYLDSVSEYAEDKSIKSLMKLDFNAVAQGYSVDRIAYYIRGCGIENYLVELGGEVRARGDKHGTPWTVGIDKPIPVEEGRELQAVVELGDSAMATSGNYRKVYEVDGRKFPHTIDPRTGYPVQHNLLSATVISNTCASADAYATTFMVVGRDKTIEWVKEKRFGLIKVYLIYEENGELKTWKSEGMEIKDPPKQ